MVSKQIPTVSEIVEQLGGRNAVAERYGVTYKAVWNWCNWNRFPLRLHLPLTRDARKQNLHIPDQLFEPVEKATA